MKEICENCLETTDSEDIIQLVLKQDMGILLVCRDCYNGATSILQKEGN